MVQQTLRHIKFRSSRILIAINHENRRGCQRNTLTDFERSFDTLKRNLSLEIGSNIKLPVQGLFVNDLSLRWTNKSQGTFYYYFLLLKIKPFQLNSLSNHQLNLIKLNNYMLKRYSFYYYIGRTVHFRFYSSGGQLRKGKVLTP